MVANRQCLFRGTQKEDDLCRSMQARLCVSFPVHLYMKSLIHIVFKRAVSRDKYFFEGLHFLISTFSVRGDGFHDLSKTFYYPIQLFTFYLLLLNY